MLKNLTLLFYISLFVGNPSVAGGLLSKKAEAEKNWIIFRKPAGKDLNMWNWLAAEYQIDTRVYEEDIEFVLPDGWQCVLSENKSIYSIKDAQGLLLINFIGPKNRPVTAIFFKKNIESLQKVTKKP